MADRTSAELFSIIFNLIDEHVTDPETRKLLALKFWDASCDYDFDPSQMYCDEALTRLGLAREGVDPNYPDDGPTTLYGPDGKE